MRTAPLSPRIASAAMARPRPRTARRSAARLAALVLLCAPAAAGCAVADPQGVVGTTHAEPGAVPAHVSSSAAPAPREVPFAWVTVPAGKDVTELEVPAHVHGLLVSVAGAQGGDPRHDLYQAWGAQADGVVRVQPGDKLQVAVGLRGGNADAGGPGSGGWSVPGFGGGDGGDGHGLAQQGGAGGGGASVVALNGEPVLVAGGGGGRGGSSGIAPGTFGGSAGVYRGGDGGTEPELPADATAYGGSPEHPDNQPAGASTSRSKTLAGGGGGGGGQHLGRGGSQARPSRSDPDYPTAGFGGGGGSSYAADVTTGVQYHVDPDGKNSMGGRAGDGMARYRWIPDLAFYAFGKIGAPGVELVQAAPGGGHDGAAVTTGHRVTDSTGNVVRSQVWLFQTSDSPVEGTLTNADTGLCLEVDHDFVDQWRCDDQRTQRWRIITAPDDSVSVMLVDPSHADAYLAISGHPEDVTDGTRLTLYSAPGAPQTTWSGTIVG